MGRFVKLATIVTVFFLCINCAPAVPSSQPLTSTATSTPTQYNSPETSVFAQVLRIVDGDGIEASIDGKKCEIRYIGIDTPELSLAGKPADPLGPEAAAKNKEVVGGKMVRLEKDVSETDRYGRLLRYVYVGDLFVNAELVKSGYARATPYPPDIKYRDYFQQLQAQAKASGLGLWANSNNQTPVQTQTNTISPTQPNSQATEQYIGNKNSKIFHRMSCNSVTQMKDSNKIMLNSRDEAISKGYQPCKNCNP
jgi:micrococcal nuclease